MRFVESLLRLFILSRLITDLINPLIISIYAEVRGLIVPKLCHKHREIFDLF